MKLIWDFQCGEGGEGGGGGVKKIPSVGLGRKTILFSTEPM